MKILELRERTKQRLGSRYDIREFPPACARPGPVPLDVLDASITRWLRSREGRWALIRQVGVLAADGENRWHTAGRRSGGRAMWSWCDR